MGPPYYESIEVNGIVSDVGASGFTITLHSFSSIPETLTISGVGIANNSGITQNFVTNESDQGGSIIFTNSATAGDLTVFTNNNAKGGGTVFVGTSSSGSGTFISNAGQTTFADTSTAANATLIANGLDFGSAIFFEGDSTGGTARVEVLAGNFNDGNLDISHSASLNAGG
jgi:hypothetical protein